MVPMWALEHPCGHRCFEPDGAENEGPQLVSLTGNIGAPEPPNGNSQRSQLLLQPSGPGTNLSNLLGAQGVASGAGDRI